jgi:hypothetical protein
MHYFICVGDLFVSWLSPFQPHLRSLAHAFFPSVKRLKTCPQFIFIFLFLVVIILGIYSQCLKTNLGMCQGLSEIELNVSDSINLNKQTYGGYCSQVNNQVE